MARCIGITKKGKQCTKPAIRGEEYCFTHHPDLEEERKLASARGGHASQTYKPLAEVDVVDGDDLVVDMLQEILAHIRKSKAKMTPEMMRTVTAAASALDRAEERRFNRGSDVTKIEVEYVNDWRGSQAS